MAAYEFTVSVSTQYLAEQSDPDRASYVFAYAITIKNTGQVAAQLISRHWVITDANNHVEEVRGLGVVGHQPFLAPGEQFEYTSGTALADAARVDDWASISVWPRMANSSRPRYRNSCCRCPAPCTDFSALSSTLHSSRFFACDGGDRFGFGRENMVHQTMKTSIQASRSLLQQLITTWRTLLQCYLLVLVYSQPRLRSQSVLVPQHNRPSRPSSLVCRPFKPP